MDSTSTNTSTPNKGGREIDVRDAIGYLICKLWIIALVVLCFMIIMFLYTRFMITPVYTTTSTNIINNKNDPDKYQNQTITSDLSVSIQLTKMSEKIFSGDKFCALVAEKLNTNDQYILAALEGNTEGFSYKTFEEFLISEFNAKEIGARTIQSSISVEADVDACAVTLSFTTPNKYLSAAISYAANDSIQEHLQAIIKAESVFTGVVEEGRLATAPSNIHPLRNMMLGAVVGFVLICAILLAIYVFDDKIKVPDDIEKYLKMSVLGEIPEIEEEV